MVSGTMAELRLRKPVPLQRRLVDARLARRLDVALLDQLVEDGLSVARKGGLDDISDPSPFVTSARKTRRATQDSNLRPSAPEADALSS